MLSITECSWKPFPLCGVLPKWMQLLITCKCAPYKGAAVYSWCQRQDWLIGIKAECSLHTLKHAYFSLRSGVFPRCNICKNSSLLHCCFSTMLCFPVHQPNWTYSYCSSCVAPSSRLRINFPRRAYRSVLHGCFACGEIHFPHAVFKHE